MGARTSPHPTEQTLGDYGLGKLDHDSAEAVHSHLETCEACRRRTSEMTSDSFLVRFQGARSTAGSLAGLGGPLPMQSQAEAGISIPAGSLPPELVDHRDYKVVRELGRGGMGVVYLAENTLMGRMEVLKVMARHMTERPEVLDRFLREIRSVARLRHTNIVAAYHAFRIDKSLVFAMEHVDGFDLSKMVKSRGPLPVAHACLFTQQAALGLQHAHEEGMVHRDIKPGNLMVSRRGEKAVVKVLDFGLAKAAREGEFDGALTHEGQMLGTPDFIAPEQIVDAQKADIRADIYSLGCTLYYLLSGGPPFRGTSLYDLFQAHHSMDAKPLNFARPEVPAELAAVVAKMMAKEPERRFRTPVEVSAALTPFTKKGSVTLKPAKADVPQVAAPEVRRSAPAVKQAPPAPATAKESRKSAEPDRPEAKWSSLIDFRDTKPKAEVAGAIEPAVETSARPGWFWPAVAAGVLLFGFLAAWMGGVIRIRTPDGTIVLEGSLEGAEVFIDGKRAKVTLAGYEFSVAPGAHKVRVRHGDRTWDSANILVAAGEKTPPIHVFLEEVATGGADAQAGKPPVPLDAGRGFDPAQSTTFGGGRWEVEGDELIQSDEGAQFPVILFGDGRWTDYDFTVDMMRMRGQSDASLVVRSTEEDRNLRFAVSGRGGWKYCFVEASEGEPRPPLKWVEYPIVSDKWYTARVRVRGGHLTGTLRDGDRDVVVLDVDDDLHPEGGVGLRTWTSAWRFRNIRVTAPDGKVLWEGPPRVPVPSDGAAVVSTVSGGNSGASMDKSPGTLANGARRFWNCSFATFENIEPGRWREINNSHRRIFYYQESGRTKESVELFDQDRGGAGGLWIRLGEVRGEITIDRPKGWKPLADGRWTPTAVLVERITAEEAGRRLVADIGKFREPGRVAARGVAFKDIADECFADFARRVTAFRAATRGDASGLKSWSKAVRESRIFRPDPDDRMRIQVYPHLAGQGHEVRKQLGEASYDVELLLQATGGTGGPTPRIGHIPDARAGKPVPRANIGPGDWTIEGDELFQSDDQVGAEVVFGDPEWSDYDLTLEAQKTKGSGHGLQVAFHRLGPETFGWLGLGVFDNKGCEMYFRKDGKGSRASDDREDNWAGRGINEGEWYAIRIEVRKSHFKCYLDNALIFEGSHSSLTHGRLGINTGKVQARFRKIKVAAPGGAVLFEGLPDLYPTSKTPTPVVSGKLPAVPLFNGKDLTGWIDLLPNGSEWKLADGLLEGHGSGKAGGPGILVLKRNDLKNFRLRAKVRHRAEFPGWVEVRRSAVGDLVNGYAVSTGPWPKGPGAPVGSVGEHTNHRYGTALGGMFGATPTDVGVGEWFDLMIDVYGNTVATSVNGKWVGEYTDPDASHRSGSIALGCSWNATVQYQSITLEEFPDRDDRASTPAGAGSVADSEGWKPLFNGENLADYDIGWPEQHRWSIVGGTIVSAAPGSYTVLHTKRKYSDFHLRLETMPAEGVAGSIDFRWKGPLAAGSFYAISIAGSENGQGPQKTGNLQIWTDGKRADVATASGPLTSLAPGQWFRMEIIAVGDTIRVIIRGEEVLRYKDPNRLRTSGPIGLFCRANSTVRFRNIQIKELLATAGG